MKKILVLLVVVSAITFSNAQETMYGVRGGAVYSNLSYDNDVSFDNDSRIGAFFGGFVDFGVSKKLSVMVEAQFSAEGAKDKPFRLGLIQIPVQIRYDLWETVKIGVGPQMSFVTWTHQDIFTQYMFSALGSIEVMVTDMIFLDLRYNHGITNILKEGSLEDNKAYNRSVQLGIGLKL